MRELGASDQDRFAGLGMAVVKKGLKHIMIGTAIAVDPTMHLIEPRFWLPPRRAPMSI